MISALFFLWYETDSAKMEDLLAAVEPLERDPLLQRGVTLLPTKQRGFLGSLLSRDTKPGIVRSSRG